MISLRAVETADIERFFEHQSESQAVAMAAWPARDRATHFAHWERILGDLDVIARTVVDDDQVVGDVVAWLDDGRRLVGYWIGRAHWGRGVASEALAQFVREIGDRPLYAYVAVENRGSIRVLEKNGFTPAPTQPDGPGEDGVEERLFILR